MDEHAPNQTQQHNSQSQSTPPYIKALKEIGSWVICIVIAIAVAFIIRTYFFQFVKVSGHSMNPTLKDGEQLIARVIGYEPERGDVIIFTPKYTKNKVYVKRVIATEGDRIWIDNYTGEVNLKKAGSDVWEILDEPYINQAEVYSLNNPNSTLVPNDDSGEPGILIQKDHLFVMGDNRNHSNDSRNDQGFEPVGQVSEDLVMGKVVLRWWPFSAFGSIYPAGSPSANALNTVGIWLLCIAIVFVILTIVRKYILCYVKIVGSSMKPTLENKKHVFVRLLGLHPERGDVVVFTHEDSTRKVYAKRVIAVAGDSVWYDESNGDVYLKKSDDKMWQLLDEPYAAKSQQHSSNESIDKGNIAEENCILIQENEIFVIGDNRTDIKNADPSEAFGRISTDLVRGKALISEK